MNRTTWSMSEVAQFLNYISKLSNYSDYRGFRLTSIFFFAEISLIFPANFSTKLLFLALLILNSLILKIAYAIFNTLLLFSMSLTDADCNKKPYTSFLDLLF